MSMKEIEAAARVAIDTIRRTMPRGASNIAQRLNTQDDLDVVNRVEAMRYVVGQVTTMLKGEAQIEAKKKLLTSILAVKSQAGNCYEQATAAYLLLQNQGIAGAQLLKIEMKVLGGSDNHIFVGIHLNGQSLAGLKGYELGDKASVRICDPWLAELLNKAGHSEYASGVYAPDEWEELIGKDGMNVSDTKKKVESA